MSALKKIVLAGDFELVGGGSYEFVSGFRETYLDDLTRDKRISREAESRRCLRQWHRRRLCAGGRWNASAAR